MSINLDIRTHAKCGYQLATGECFMSDEFGCDLPCDEESHEQRETLRDKFAMSAIIGLASWEPEQAARLAYRVADAMLEARKK